MKIAVIGTGYVGLVSGACLAHFGHTVICVDNNQQKIERLILGEVPFYEPGLEELVKENVDAGRLAFTIDYDRAIPSAEAIFIAVGTPERHGDGYADLKFVYAAAKELAKHLKKYAVIIDKSTVPVGTAAQVKRIIHKTNRKAKFDVASNPEFLREGAAIDDFMKPDRIVIGVETDKAENVLKNIYKPLTRGAGEFPILVTNPATAELIKYASNGFLAVKISYINEMANLCEATGADVVALAKGMGLDNRIGKKFLNAGPGYGGSCFPKDTKALMRIAQEHNSPTRIIETTVEVNAAQKAHMVGKIRKALGGKESNKTIAVLGLTFKPETDDMRESPSLTILPVLFGKGANIRAHDPKGMDMAKADKDMPSEIVYCKDAYDACKKADCVVLMTEWDEYRALDLQKVKRLMKGKVFVDLRNVYDPGMMKELGFKYTGVGRS